MAKKKMTPQAAEKTLKKPARRGRNFNFWLPEEIAVQLDAYMATIPVETKYTAHFQKALREYLAARGFPAEE